jgi:hypothetical protein
MVLVKGPFSPSFLGSRSTNLFRRVALSDGELTSFLWV